MIYRRQKIKKKSVLQTKAASAKQQFKIERETEEAKEAILQATADGVEIVYIDEYMCTTR